MTTRFEAGDLFEIVTSGGLGYVQYVYTDQEMGDFLRVLPGVFPERVEDAEWLAAREEAFFTFFPLKAALEKKIVSRVAQASVPAHVGKPPLLRSPGRVNPATRTVESWWLWDGTRSWQVERLNELQKQLSLEAILNDTLLAERIVSGWRPADYV
jgi:hypothetical protein